MVMGGSGGYRRLTGESDDFSLHTDTHHNIYIIVSFLVMTSNDYNSNGYKVVSPIGRLRRMDDDIMMPSHSTLWRKRSEVTKDIEDMALPLLLLLL